MIAAIVAINQGVIGPYYEVMECGKLASFYGAADELLAKYPVCTDLGSFAIVSGFGDAVENEAAAARAAFGAVTWVAVVLHMVGVEAYVRSRAHL